MKTSRNPPRLEARKLPGQKRSTATVEAILEAAARILEREGLAGYTTNAVAQRAGVSIGSLYQYFPGKDAITRALIVRETSALLNAVATIETAASGRDGLRCMIDVAVAYQLRRPTLARMLDIEERRLPVDEHIESVAIQLARYLRQFLDAPDLRPLEQERFAVEDILAMIKGMVDGAGERNERDADRLAYRVRRAVFGYLGIPGLEADSADRG